MMNGKGRTNPHLPLYSQQSHPHTCCSQINRSKTFLISNTSCQTCFHSKIQHQYPQQYHTAHLIRNELFAEQNQKGLTGDDYVHMLFIDNVTSVIEIYAIITKYVIYMSSTIYVLIIQGCQQLNINYTLNNLLLFITTLNEMRGCRCI